MKGKIIILIITLLCVSSMIIFDKDVKIKATGDGGEENNNGNSIGLDFNYMLNITEVLSNVVHKVSDKMIFIRVVILVQMVTDGQHNIFTGK